MTIKFLVPWLPFHVSFSSRSLSKEKHCVKRTKPAIRTWRTFSRYLTGIEPTSRKGSDDLSQALSLHTETRHATHLLIKHFPCTLFAYLRIITLQFTVNVVRDEAKPKDATHFFSFSSRQHSLLSMTSCHMIDFMASVKRYF